MELTHEEKLIIENVREIAELQYQHTEFFKKALNAIESLEVPAPTPYRPEQKGSLLDIETKKYNLHDEFTIQLSKIKNTLKSLAK